MPGILHSHAKYPFPFEGGDIEDLLCFRLVDDATNDFLFRW